MNQQTNLQTVVQSKTFPGSSDSSRSSDVLDTAIAKFIYALSEYVSFLERRSGVTESDMASHKVNLFSSCPDIEELSLNCAMPVILFAEAVKSLKDYQFFASNTADFQVHLQTLRDLWNMAEDYYQNTPTLELLDQKIILLHAVLLLTPASHPSRDIPCLKLGEALTARFTRTHELSDLDLAIVYYREAYLVQIDAYVLMLELAKCTRMRFKLTRGLDDLDDTINILRDMLSEMSPSHRFRFVCLHNLGSLMMEKYKIENYFTILEEAIACYREAIELCHSTTEDMDASSAISTIVVSFSSALLKWHEVAALKVDAKDVVSVLKAYLSLDPDTESDEYAQLLHLLTRLLSSSSTDQKYSDDMVSVIRNFVGLKPSSDIQRYLGLHAFCAILIARFSVSQNLQDISEAITAYRDSLAFSPPIDVAGDKAGSIELLAGLLKQRFRLVPDDEDAQEVIAIYRDILVSAPSNNRPSVMKEFADFLRVRFEFNPQLEDREEALVLYREALQIVSADDTKISSQFDLLVDVSQTLLLVKGNDDEQEEQFRVNVDEAIDHLKVAISLPGCDSQENYSDARRLLSACLLARYELAHNSDDLNESAKLTENDEESYDFTSELRNTMVLDMDKIRDAEALEEVVVKLRQSLEFQPFPHPSRPETLTRLGKGLALQFTLGGPKKRLEEAILRLREAVSLSPKSVIAMITLADALFQKAEVEGFLSTGHLIEEMKDIFRKCVPLFPENMGGVADTFRIRIEEQLVNGDSSALDTISMIHDINEINTQNPFEAARSMSFVYWMTFTTSEDIKDLDESIHHSREAAHNCPDDHPRGAAVFHDLGSRLIKRYDLLNDAEDLDEALDCYLKCIQILPPGSYYKSIYFGEFGMAMIKKINNFNQAELEEEDMHGFPVLIEAVAALFHAGAMNSASPVPDRFRAAKVWAVIADLCNHESALVAYQQAIDLLPRLSSMGANVASRQATFRTYGIDGLSRNAALFAIKAEKYDKAVEFLEAGRAVFWLQALQLRSPMENLRDRHPDLHSKLSGISAELENASLHMNVSHDRRSSAEKRVQDEEIFRLEELNEEWLRTVDEIHMLEDFDDFLLPQSLPKLQALIDCPIIFLVPDENQSHALIMFSDDVLHVNLLNVTYERLQSLVSKMPGAGSFVFRRRSRGAISDLLSDLEPEGTVELENNHRQDRKGGPRHFKHVDAEDEVKYVLETLWNDVVGPIVHELRPRMTESLLKVCWCPTGIFSFLPLHAAGIYRNDMSSIECIFDYLISSYTPTVGALSQRSIGESKPDKFKMMVVVDPKRLPNTMYELTAIERHVDKEYLLRLGTPESPAFVETVASNLSDVSIVHFACHGMQNEQPLDSSLILHDGDLKISRIMEERMPNAALAFLCACETAMGDKNLPDEAMHLGATLLYSGFRGVVATMWSIDDEDGPIVADQVYARLFKDDSKKPNTALAAEAVHDAIMLLRERQVGFKRWVPFIHLGL